MKVSKKRVSRDEFITALNAASGYFSMNPKTKLGFFCSQFIDFNKNLSKQVNKAQNKITAELKLEMSTFRVQHALEKDGQLVLNAKGEYTYNRDGEVEIIKKQEEIKEKLEEILEPFLNEEVEVKCIVSPFDLPKDIDPFMVKALNGFAFQNKNEFEENIEEA
ncbi:MAG: hypothetical protein K0S44_231 [Bacteroidetes bacterium]|jgi:hypothetical protein|nr:hypothetical protein [Bacteroidota bacterium]